MFSTVLPHKLFLGEVHPALSDHVKGDKKLKLDRGSKLDEGCVIS